MNNQSVKTPRITSVLFNLPLTGRIKVPPDTARGLKNVLWEEVKPNASKIKGAFLSPKSASGLGASSFCLAFRNNRYRRSVCGRFSVCPDAATQQVHERRTSRSRKIYRGRRGEVWT